uniref:glycylpeptide N-tetradecanoyltransferase n=1 Tax=Phlebotomus papatasi TaxID=29031 RepID=A0A1B0DCP4_PHLPP
MEETNGKVPGKSQARQKRRKERSKAAGEADGKTSEEVNAKDEGVVQEDGAEPVSSPMNEDVLSNMRGLVEQLKVGSKFLMRNPKTPDEAKQRSFKFWSTQPVPKLDETISTNEPIDEARDVEAIRQEPYSLPDGFKWDTLEIDQAGVLQELYTLLNENYVEDEDAMFRFDYQPEFLKWALQPPGWRMDWHVGVRVVKSGRLVGFISAIPGQVRIYDKTESVVEINFLCVHKKLRAKRVAPVLIREITRRVNLTGIFQAVYTAGVVLPKPVSTCRYWHRSLNPKKLIEVS